MIYKLIILVASIFMIYEFTKSRSTAVASIEPTIIKTAVIFSPTSKFENECLKNIIIRYVRKRIKTDVNLASQTHQVPHIGFPHNDPVIRQIKVKTAPIGATAVLTINQKGILNARATIL